MCHSTKGGASVAAATLPDGQAAQAPSGMVFVVFGFGTGCAGSTLGSLMGRFAGTRYPVGHLPVPSNTPLFTRHDLQTTCVKVSGRG